MPQQSAVAGAAELRKKLKSHEELERRLYTALISDHIERGTDIAGELWDYAERMSGCVPDDEDDYGYYKD